MSKVRVDWDIVIVGGGLAGSSLALALKGCGLRILVVDAARPRRDGGLASHDERVLALAYGSKRILESLGVWSGLEVDATPIRRIHVSDRGHFGVVRLDCQEEGLEALGYVVPMRPLGRALAGAVRSQGGAEFRAPALCRDVVDAAGGVEILLEEQSGVNSIRARLLVLADGGRSGIAERLGIHARVRDYGQTAIIANVDTSHGHDGVAYERFTDTGPLALLPLSGKRCALVWSAVPEQADTLAGLSDLQFLDALQQRFGDRLGRFSQAGARHAYPLRLVQVSAQVSGRVVLVGNAAHTLHPIAGQGFNLGLRDVAVLAEVLGGAVGAGRDPGDAGLLQEYERRRRFDQRRAVRLTDGLARLFASRFPGLAAARSTGMVLMELAPSLRHWFARTAMGMAAPVPGLARGLVACRSVARGEDSR